MAEGFILEPLGAMAALLEASSALAGVKVRELTGGDIDREADRIIVQPPAVLIAIPAVRLEAGRDHIRLTYQSAAQVFFYVGASNLRGDAPERESTLALLTSVCDVLAGAKLALTAPNQGGRIRLVSVALAQLEREGTWYRLEAAFEGMAQFSGANA